MWPLPPQKSYRQEGCMRMNATNEGPLDPAAIAAAWGARAAAAGFGPEAVGALRTASWIPELYPRCAVPVEYLVLVHDHERAVEDTIKVTASWCLASSVGRVDTVIATTPTLVAAIRAGESARVARGIGVGVVVCDCAEPKRTNGPGHSYPEPGYQLPGRSLLTRYVRWVTDDQRLAEVVREACPAISVLTTVGPISPEGELLEPRLSPDRDEHYWVMEGSVPTWR
jgi:hypothetical protein